MVDAESEQSGMGSMWYWNLAGMKTLRIEWYAQVPFSRHQIYHSCGPSVKRMPHWFYYSGFLSTRMWRIRLITAT